MSHHEYVILPCTYLLSIYIYCKYYYRFLTAENWSFYPCLTSKFRLEIYFLIFFFLTNEDLRDKETGKRYTKAFVQSHFVCTRTQIARRFCVGICGRDNRRCIRTPYHRIFHSKLSFFSVDTFHPIRDYLSLIGF